MIENKEIPIPEELENWISDWLFKHVESAPIDLEEHVRVTTSCRAIVYQAYRHLSTQSSYPRLKEGDKVVLDKDFNNASVVTLIRMTKHYSTVGDGESKWDTMTNRLSPIGRHIEEPDSTNTAQ